MIFFAHYLNAEVIDPTERTIGKLKDMIARADEDYPLIEAIVIKERKSGEEILIPISYIENFGYPEITLKARLEKIEPYNPTDKDFRIYKDVIDKQIVDIAGSRVVRVNDIQLGKVEERLRVLSIDISTRGLLRRLGLDKWKISRLLPLKLIDWKSVQLIDGALKLKTVSKDLQKLHAADLANILEELSPKQGLSLINALEPEKAAKVFQELTPNQRRFLIDILGEARAKTMLDNVPMDDLVDFMKTLSYKESKKILSYLNKERLQKVEEFIKYPNDTAGGLMTSDFIKVKPDWTIGDTIKYIKEISPRFRSIFFVYVIDETDKLLGVASVRTLITKDETDTMKKVMKSLRKIHVIHPHTRVKKIAEIMTKYNLYSIAVTDKTHKLLGIVTVDDVMRCLMPYS
ncbi:magnesium transporter [Candidatus Peregrinibacteria bacterium]|nr:magnesium transporter [Candidatus Peregrinibacteria bacterium]